MKFKKIMFVSILLLAILTIGAVSANEINTTGEVAIDDGDLITAEVSEDISADSQEDVLNAKDAGTFTALQNKINAANNGSVITLENDYKYDEGFENTHIEISKPLTIDGNGHTIDALSKSRIFSVYSDDVTLKNIKFVNGNAQGAGGAIYSSGANFKVINSIFTDNIANANGGAIYSSGTNCRITNSMFENNKGWSGGAIGSGGTNCNIINSTFTNNIAVKTLTGTQIGNSWYPYYAGGYGGAIYSEGSNCNIADSIFTKNTADRKGGAVCVEGSNGNLSYSTFRDNVADESGGAIYWEADDGVISYCSYTKDFTQGNDLVCGEDVVVIEDSVKINVVDMSKYYGNSITFIATVTKDDAPVSGVNVKISANGKTQTVSTNSKGQASVNLNLPVGTHEVTTEYDGVKATSNVNVKSTIAASDISGTYSNAKATATFLDTAGKALASKQATFKIGTATYTATTNANGVAIANIPLAVGTYTVTAINPTTKEEKQFKLTISKADSTVVLSAIQNGKSVTLTATVTPSGATGKITFAVIPTVVYDSGIVQFLSEKRKDYQSNIVNGKATVTIPDLAIGSYSAVVIYDGDSNMMPFESDFTDFKVNKVYSIINAGDTKGTYLDSKVSATFLDGSGKELANTKVTFKVGGKSFSATTNSKGVATAKVDLDAGDYNVVAVNPATKEEKQFKLTIDKATPEFTLKAGKSDLRITADGKPVVTITATFSPNTVTGEVTVSSEGSMSYYDTITNGQAVVTTFYASNVAYDVIVSYSGDNNFKAVEKAYSFNVSNAKPVLTAESISFVYGNAKDIIINLNDDDGTPIADKDISLKIYIDADRYYSYSEQSDENGQLKVSTKGLGPNNYLAYINSEGCKEITAKITIKKATPKITASKKTFKVNVKTKKYTITLKTNMNKVMKNKKVTLKVNGKTYKATTNSKGKATFKITKLTKKGKFNAVIKFAGNSYYKMVTKTIRITVKK